MLVGGLFFCQSAGRLTLFKPAAKAGEKLVTIYDRGAERRLLQSEDDSRGFEIG